MDVVGVLKSPTISPDELEDAFTEGIGFDGSPVGSPTCAHGSGMPLIPDVQTFQLLSWRNAKESVARTFCDVHTLNRQRVHSDPRTVLQRAVERARVLGFTIMVYPEIEFYLLCQPVSINHMIPVDNAGYFDHAVREDSNDSRRQAIRMLEDTSTTVEFSHHGDGSGQNEIDLRAVDAMTAADNIMTAHAVTEKVTLHEFLVATLMSKSLIDHLDSEMHTHISPFEGNESTLYRPSGEHRLSLAGKCFTAGLPECTYELTAVTNQHVDSYKCLRGGAEAPAYVCWGHNNSSALVRTPLYRPDKRRAAKIEYRASDPAADPYLALAVLIVAGLDGIERRCEFVPEAEGNIWDLTDRERQALGIRALPSSLSFAVRGMRESDLAVETLGEKVFAYVMRNKEEERHEYRRQVTPQEIRQFLKVY